MTLTPGLRNEDVRRLRSVYPQAEPSERRARAAHRRSAGAAVPAALKRITKAVIRRAIAWYVDPTAQAAARQAARAASRRLEAQLPDRGLGDEARITAINQELLKAEFRALRETVETMRSAERTRSVLADAALQGMASGAGAWMLTTQPEGYLETLRAHAPVLHLGCGRGDLVNSLTEAGIEASGVDADAAVIAEAQALGRHVRQGDAVEALRAHASRSLGAVVALHQIEHVQLAGVLRLIELARDRLRPGGLFIAEARNPASLLVLESTYLDPVHARPLHPSLLAFLCERAGFRAVEVRFHEPGRGDRLPLIEGDGVPEWTATINTAFNRLNDVLFGPQTYAVIATA